MLSGAPLTDLSGYAKKSTANGDTRSVIRLRLRIAGPGRAADADPHQHLTRRKFNPRSLVAGSRRIFGRPQEERLFTNAGCSRGLNPSVSSRDPGDVVGEVAEAESGAAQVLQAAVDRFGWTVAGAGPVEVGQYVSGSLAQGAAELGDLDQRPGDAGAERLDQLDPRGRGPY